MSSRRGPPLLSGALVLLLATLASPLPKPHGPLPDAREEAGLAPALGARLPPDARFADVTGRERAFGELLRGKPVILAPVYFSCAGLCGTTLNGLLRALRALPGSAGRDFDVIVVSFDPRDGPAQAAARKTQLLKAYRRPGSQAGWRVVVTAGDGASRLLEAAGFRASFDAESGQYAHPAALFILTPDGRVSRALSGVEFPPRDLRLALAEAAGGRVGTLSDRVMLLCFRWDPSKGRYTPSILLALRLLGVGALGGLAVLVLRLRSMSRRERRWMA